MRVRAFDELIMDAMEGQLTKTAPGGGIHPYVEIFCASMGRVMVEYAGIAYQAQAPAVFVIAANTPHRIFRLTPAFRCWYIELEHGATDSILDQEVVARWNELQTLDSTQRPLASLLDYTLQSIYTGFTQQWHQRPSTTGNAILTLDLRKLFLLIEEAVAQSNPPGDHRAGEVSMALQKYSSQQQIYHLIRFIEAAYTTEITLTTLAKRSGLTPSYIIRLFKESIGLTPIQYVQQLRLHAAISYLNTTTLPIQDIAEICGLKSLHYFSRLFKQKFGESPTQWRLRHSL